MPQELVSLIIDYILDIWKININYLGQNKSRHDRRVILKQIIIEQNENIILINNTLLGFYDVGFSLANYGMILIYKKQDKIHYKTNSKHKVKYTLYEDMYIFGEYKKYSHSTSIMVDNHIILIDINQAKHLKWRLENIKDDNKYILCYSSHKNSSIIKIIKREINKTNDDIDKHITYIINTLSYTESAYDTEIKEYSSKIKINFDKQEYNIMIISHWSNYIISCIVLTKEEVHTLINEMSKVINKECEIMRELYVKNNEQRN